MTDDRDLLRAWAEGSDEAAATLVERHYDAIRRFFVNKAGAEADDLVQRTFLACAESAASFRGESSFRSFLFGIARNVLFEHIRRRVKDGRNEPDFRDSAIVDLSPGVATMATRRAEEQLLARALQHVPVELQITLELFYWEELSVEEIGVVLGVPAGTVKSRLHRARGVLREVIERLPATPQERTSALDLLRPA
jgi:RNA polymerase sigma factor (sigma-70 family)